MIYIVLMTNKDFPGGSVGKASVYNSGDLGSIPGLGRFPGEGKGNPLQYFCLENPMDGGAWCPWGRKESDTTERLHFQTFSFKLSLSMTNNIGNALLKHWIIHYLNFVILLFTLQMYIKYFLLIYARPWRRNDNSPFVGEGMNGSSWWVWWWGNEQILCWLLSFSHWDKQHDQLRIRRETGDVVIKE